MIKLRLSVGKNVYDNVGWINPMTAEKYSLKEGDVLLDKSFRVAPIKISISDLVKENEISLPTHIMFKLGAIIGEEREFEVVDDIKVAKEVELYVVGVIKDWVQFSRERKEFIVTLDDELAIAPRTSIRILDIEGASVGEVYKITNDTKIRLQFSGLMNMGIAIDSSMAMLDRWNGTRKVDLAKDIAKILLEYNLRKTSTCAIFSYADSVDILLNWITIDPKLRWFMTVLIPRFVTDMIIRETNDRVLDEVLEVIIDGFEKRSSKEYINTIIVIQAGETKLNENKLHDLRDRLSEISNGFWRTIWVGIGSEDFDSLRKAAQIFGGKFIYGKTHAGLIKRARGLADFRHVDNMW